MSREHLHFVTGRLAEAALRETVERLAGQVGFEYSIGVMPITVAALMTPAWIARRLAPPAGTTRIILPGYCDGDLAPLQQRCRVPIELGPKDLRQLPEHFGQAAGRAADYGSYDIQILAEIACAMMPDKNREALSEARNGEELFTVLRRLLISNAADGGPCAQPAG